MQKQTSFEIKLLNREPLKLANHTRKGPHKAGRSRGMRSGLGATQSDEVSWLAADNARDVSRPHCQSGFHRLAILGVIVSARDSRLVPASVIQNCLDHMRLNPKLVHIGRYGVAQIMQTPAARAARLQQSTLAECPSDEAVAA